MSESPIHDDLAAERFRARLDDDEFDTWLRDGLARWGDEA